jgi:hypothetical protein
MKYRYLVIILAVLASACNQNQQSVSKTDTVIQKQVEISNKTKADTIADTIKKIMGYSVAHNFSDSTYKDIFSINLYGKTILSGVVVFQIFDHTHKSIFKETYHAQDLLGDMGDVLNNRQKQDTIKKRLADFLDTRKFISPAIDPKETFDNAYSSADNADKPEWEEIKKDKSSIGFMYNYGYELWNNFF